jgi:hypothetical protein
VSDVNENELAIEAIAEAVAREATRETRRTAADAEREARWQEHLDRVRDRVRRVYPGAIDGSVNFSDKSTPDAYTDRVREHLATGGSWDTVEWGPPPQYEEDVRSLTREDIQRLADEHGHEKACALIAAAARKQLKNIKLVVEVGEAGARAREVKEAWRLDHPGSRRVRLETRNEESARVHAENETLEQMERRAAHGRAMGVHAALQREQELRHGAIYIQGADGDPVTVYVKSKLDADVRDVHGRRVSVYSPKKLAPGVMVVAEDEPATAPSEQENATTKPPAKRKRRSKKP